VAPFDEGPGPPPDFDRSSVRAEAGPNPELVDFTRRFWIGLVLTLPVFLLEMGGHLTGMMHLVGGPRVGNWIQLALATPVVLWAGWPFFVRGWQSLVNRSLNMFTLIALGTGVAWVFSVVATLAPGIFPAAVRAADGAVAVYFEAAAVIVVLVLLGQVLELRAREQTGGPIPALRIIFALLAAVLALVQFTAPHSWLAVGTVLLWGAVAFGNVPGLQVYVVKQAERFPPQAVDVAPGLNIAAFNLGIAGAAWAGGLAL